MRTVFLSCHFGDADRDLMRQVEGLLESHGLRVITGEEPGGGPLTPAVMKRIAESDALVALMTKRNNPPDYGGTHPWVVDDLKYAMAITKRGDRVCRPRSGGRRGIQGTRADRI